VLDWGAKSGGLSLPFAEPIQAAKQLLAVEGPVLASGHGVEELVQFGRDLFR
jgi:hypothetical protein